MKNKFKYLICIIIFTAITYFSIYRFNSKKLTEEINHPKIEQSKEGDAANTKNENFCIMIAENMRFQKIHYEDSSLSIVVKEINESVHQHLISLGIKPDKFNISTDGSDQSKISLSAPNISLMLLLKIIAEQANLQLEINDSGALLHTKKPEW